ncbi:MAG: TonB-dependent receptor [Acidobacteriaceae bacterium]|nr:TonB-dependent receptor [Acidobacteriaceae bacterium]
MQIWRLLALLTMSGGAFCAFSQANTGTILGTVSDSSGATVPGCRITVQNQNTGTIKQFTTDSDGSYRISYLLPGVYDVTAEAPSFKKAVQTGIILEVDQKVAANFSLVLGEVTESVHVVSQAPQLQTQSVEQSQVITQKQMQELPLLIRDFGQLATLQTGSILGTGGLGASYGNDNPQATGGAVHVNGLGQDANSWQIDGVSNNESVFSIISVSPSLDALQEVSIITNNYSAEYGRAGGANVQAQIKSGGNNFHGGAFEFLRNDKLDANSFFNNRSGAAKKPFRQNQYGAFIGGPIRRNKTFFFNDFEILSTREASTGVLTIPTALQRQGVFTELGQATIYDPLTGAPFPNNTVPQNRIVKPASGILSFFPEPNIPGAGLSGNYLGTSTQKHDRAMFDERIDQNFSERDQFFARYSYLETTLDTPAFLGPVLNGDPFASTAFTRNQNGVVSEVHTFSPAMINEARVGVNRVRTDFDAFGANDPTAIQVGIPGINEFCGTCGGLPTINVSGLNGFGHTPFAPTRRHDTVWQIVDNFTFIRGKHTVKSGADLQFIGANFYQTSNPVGEFDFNRNITSNQGQGGIGLASFLLGYYSFAGRNTMTVTPSNRTKNLFFFTQDDYRVSPNLTLNLGLRYEIYTAVRDAHNRISNFDLATGDILLGCIATTCTAGVDTQYGDFAPRLGIAYTPHGGRTTIRAGSGITYFSPGFGAGGIGTLNDNYPWVIGQGITPPNIFTPGPNIVNGLPVPPEPVQRPGAPAGHLIPQGSGSVFWMPRDLKQTRVYQWSLSIQRELARGLTLDTAYVGNSQNYLYVSIPGNVPRIGSDPTGQLTLDQRRPYYAVDPALQTFNMRFQGGKGAYHALQVKLEKRYSVGFSFLAGYTFSKNLNRGISYIDPFNYMVKSLAQDDVTHRLFASWVYELPFGHAKRFGSHTPALVDAVLGGWQIAGIFNYQSGFPFTPGITSNLDNGTGNLPNRVCNGSIPNPTIDRWFDPSCFQQTPVNVIGNSGFNILRGPSFSNWDVSVGKNWRIRETVRFQLRGEFLNAFNQVAFGNPNTQVDNPGAGQINGVLPNTFPRRIQIGAKLYF